MTNWKAWRSGSREHRSKLSSFDTSAIDDVEGTQHVPATAAALLGVGRRLGGKGGQSFEDAVSHGDVVSPLERIRRPAVGASRADLNYVLHMSREANRGEDSQEPNVGVAEHVDVVRAEVPANGVDVLHLEIPVAGQPRLVLSRGDLRPAAVARVEARQRLLDGPEAAVD